MISYTCWLLACLLNAVMDACENEPNFRESGLSTLNKHFWLKTVSWRYARRLFGYKFDAWHLAKTCMIVALIASVLTFEPKHEWWVYALSYGAIWNAGFYLFYHGLFKVK